MKFLSTLCFVLLISNATFAQSEFIQWKAKPALHTVSAPYKNSSAVMLEDYRLHEYRTKDQKDMFVYCEERRLVKVQDDKGVEMFNKIYISTGGKAELLKIMARTIQPDGKVLVLPDSKILDVEEEGRKYKKFAMEGIEKGSEIEYYTMIRYPIFSFNTEKFSLSSTPVEKARFCLNVPDHLVFNMKGYNGFTITPDTVINERRYTYASADNIDFFEGEKYSNTDPYLSNIQYKLSYNLAKEKYVRLNTWSELAKNIYNNYYVLNSKEGKAVDAFYKKIAIPSGAADDEKIALIEDYIKSNINIREDVISEEDNDLEKIMKRKAAGHFATIRLMMGLLERAGVPATIVFPSKRDDTPLDEELENYRLIDDMVLYINATDKFLDPVNLGTRYPIINADWAGTKGLFVKETSLGTIKSALASFDTIPLLPYESNYSNIDVQLQFNKTVDTLIINSKQMLLGYSASGYRPAFAYLEKDKQDDFVKDIIKSVAKSDSITNIKVENKEMLSGFKNLPLNIYGTIKTVEIMENAGKNILVKIGEVIGTQAQMYQENKRKLPIMLSYPHALDRTIRFTIPNGYRIKNANDLTFNVTDKNSSGIETMGFISNYSLKEQELTVNLHEFYKSIYYHINMIDIFKNVINAAADFNKVVLVLEKIQKN